MKFTFQYTKDEYARAYWMNSRKLRNPKLDAIMITLALSMGLWLLVNGEILWGGLALGSAGLLICLFLAIRFIIPYYIYNQFSTNLGSQSNETRVQKKAQLVLEERHPIILQ